VCNNLDFRIHIHICSPNFHTKHDSYIIETIYNKEIIIFTLLHTCNNGVRYDNKIFHNNKISKNYKLII